MKFSEFRKWLQQRGVSFKEGKRHTKLYFVGRQCTLPRHGSREIGEGLRRAVLKQLDIKE